jgi:hypothetical protein
MKWGSLSRWQMAPVDKQSIGDLYDGKSLPKSLANLTSTSISYPQDREAVYAEKPAPNLFSSNSNDSAKTPP